MERPGFPDQDQLLQFLKRLKEVFDVCDEDADGFIRVEHLMDLGLQFGQGDEVRGGMGYLWINDFLSDILIKNKENSLTFSLWID